jgi:hypothetical protein
LFDFAALKLKIKNEIDAIEKEVAELLVKMEKTNEEKEQNDLKNQIEKKREVLEESLKKMKISFNPDDLYSFFQKNWSTIFNEHNSYIDKLIKKNSPIKSIIIYEAPPFPKDNNLNYILLKDAKGPYFTAIKKAFTTGDDIQDKFVENGILFFDLLMLPFPLSSTIRRKWSTKPEFKINDQQLPVVLFEMNLKYYLNKLSICNEVLSGEIKIAIGTPHLTALGIYNHFCDGGRLGLDKKMNENIEESLMKCNAIEDKKNNKKLNNYVVPLFRSCFVNASNNPDGELLKHALHLPINNP